MIKLEIEIKEDKDFNEDGSFKKCEIHIKEKGYNPSVIEKKTLEIIKDKLNTEKTTQCYIEQKNRKFKEKDVNKEIKEFINFLENHKNIFDN